MKLLRALLLSLAATGLSFAADPALLRMIPPDAAFVAGVRADQIKSSRFGQYILDQIKSEEENMNKFISATGFDPRRDLTELIVASSSATPRRQNHGKTVVLARGRFDVSRIQSFALAEGSSTTNYNGVQIFTGRDDSHGWLAVVDSETAVAGDPDYVKLAIDARQATGATLDAKTLNTITGLSNRFDAWMLTASLAGIAGDIRNPQLGGAMNGNLIQSVDSVTGGVRFGSDVEVMAEAQMRSEKDATAMVDVVRFLAGMMQMNAQNDKRAAELAKLLDKMDLKATGTQFRMSLTIPEDMLETLIKPASRSKRQAF
jgi:hypothetical protein